MTTEGYREKTCSLALHFGCYKPLLQCYLFLIVILYLGSSSSSSVCHHLFSCQKGNLFNISPSSIIYLHSHWRTIVQDQQQSFTLTLLAIVLRQILLNYLSVRNPYCPLKICISSVVQLVKECVYVQVAFFINQELLELKSGDGSIRPNEIIAERKLSSAVAECILVNCIHPYLMY